MPDHLHLLVLPAADDTVSDLVGELKYVSSRKISAVRGNKGPLWQKGFFDRFMRTPKELLETLDYMHQNPVRKGLATTAEQWRWSSASAYAGRPSILAVDFLDLPAESEKPFR
jgi:putative transposase